MKRYKLLSGVLASAMIFSTFIAVPGLGIQTKAASHSALKDYTISELTTVATDLAKKGTASTYYKEFSGYMNAGLKGDGSDNGTAAIENSHWATKLSDGTTLEMRIIGIAQDVLADGSGVAGLTLQATHSLPEGVALNTAGTNKGGFEKTTGYQYLNSTVYGKLPKEVQNELVSVKKYSVADLSTEEPKVTDSSNKVFIASYAEYTGSIKSGLNALLAQEGTGAKHNEQYLAFQNKVKSNSFANDAIKNLNKTQDGQNFATTAVIANAAQKKAQVADEQRTFWNRSATGFSDVQFGMGYEDGDVSYIATATTTRGIVPCFCLGGAKGSGVTPTTTAAPTTKAPTTKAPTTAAPTTTAPTTKAPATTASTTAAPTTTAVPTTAVPTTAAPAPVAPAPAVATPVKYYDNGVFAENASAKGFDGAVGVAYQGANCLKTLYTQSPNQRVGFGAVKDLSGYDRNSRIAVTFYNTTGSTAGEIRVFAGYQSYVAVPVTFTAWQSKTLQTVSVSLSDLANAGANLSAVEGIGFFVNGTVQSRIYIKTVEITGNGAVPTPAPAQRVSVDVFANGYNANMTDSQVGFANGGTQLTCGKGNNAIAFRTALAALIPADAKDVAIEFDSSVISANKEFYFITASHNVQARAKVTTESDATGHFVIYLSQANGLTTGNTYGLGVVDYNKTVIKNIKVTYTIGG